MTSRTFRSVCAALRTAIKALPPEQRHALGDGLPRRIAAGSSYSYRIDASDFLVLCARLGIDPVNAQARAPIRDPGVLCLAAVGAGCTLQRLLCGLSLRGAADVTGVSASTIFRLERNLPISIESVLAVCEFIGVHPLGYLRQERRAA